LAFWLVLLACWLAEGPASAQAHTNVQTVFLIVMENVSWSQIKGSASAPYINNTLLPMASYCERYYSPANIANSLPNYIILEAGTNFAITGSPAPSLSSPSAHVNSTNHLVTQLRNAGISWRSYQEDISGTTCPTSTTGLYVPWHNPFIYFDDILTNSAYCIAQNRPYTELARDLQSNTVARYNFITPNLCSDMHGDGRCPTTFDRIRTGDNWLSVEIPRIMHSQAYSNNGAIFITWDESTLPPAFVPIGMIVVSPLAKGGGYASTNHYEHPSTLRTTQEIFGVRPFLYAAATAPSLGDLFRPTFSITSATMTNGQFHFILSGVTSNKTNVVQASTNLMDWVSISTNLVATNRLAFADTNATNFSGRFYRVMQWP
jgi:phospholipase C